MKSSQTEMTQINAGPDALTHQCKVALVSMAKLFKTIDQAVLQELESDYNTPSDQMSWDWENTKVELNLPASVSPNKTADVQPALESRLHAQTYLPGGRDILVTTIQAYIPASEEEVQDIVKSLVDTSVARI